MVEPEPEREIAVGLPLTRSSTAPSQICRTRTTPDRDGWVREISALSAASDTFQLQATALATKLSDTFASEIGKAYGTKTYLITTLREVKAGEEGTFSVVNCSNGRSPTCG